MKVRNLIFTHFSIKTCNFLQRRFAISLFIESTVATEFKLTINVYQIIIYNFAIETVLRKSRFLHLSSVNMQK